jgi:hypothetical protein
MSFGARALAIGVAVLLMLGSAHAQDETIQKMVGLWQGKVDVHDEPERTLVIKSVALERGQWIATIDYGPTGKSLSSLQARIERQLDTPTMTSRCPPPARSSSSCTPSASSADCSRSATGRGAGSSAR